MGVSVGVGGGGGEGRKEEAVANPSILTERTC